jgi:hypothetical protein
MSGSRGAATIAAAGALFALARMTSAPVLPDDWDGIGFVESITRFDMDHFAPHAPGYPVYVALLKAAALAFRSPLLAANVVAVQAGVFATILALLAAARAFGLGRATWVAAFVGIVPLAWRAGTAIGSEAPALFFACAAVFALTRPGPRSALLLGIATGLGMGVRLSWAPLFLAFLALAPSGQRLRAAAAFAVATLAWLVPFVAIVGPSHLASLVTVHAAGHFRAWGGSALVEPGPMRAVWLARDLFVDGLGAGSDALGIGIGILIAVLALLGGYVWREHGYRHARLALVLVPYAAWIAVGQNVHQQPRHALPLVVALAAALGLAATTSRAARGAGALLFLLVTMRTSADAHERRTILPPGAQLVELAQRIATTEHARVAVFGGPSARFFELAPNPDAVGFTVSTLGEADLALGRMNTLPTRALVTSELPNLPEASPAFTRLTTLCRPPRSDRRAPCIDVYDWKAPTLPR